MRIDLYLLGVVSGGSVSELESRHVFSQLGEMELSFEEPFLYHYPCLSFFLALLLFIVEFRVKDEIESPTVWRFVSYEKKKRILEKIGMEVEDQILRITDSWFFKQNTENVAVPII